MAVFVFSETNTIIVAPTPDNLDLLPVSTAADVTLIERKTIVQSGASSVPELLQREANVLIRSTSGNGNDGQISMRGFGENSHLRTLIVVDGHKANRPDMGRLEWDSIPLANVERIEVIRGGQNVLYGNHALAGVVKITTKRSDGSAVRANGSFGNYGYRAGSLEYDEALGAFDFRVGVYSDALDGYRTNSASRSTQFSGSIGWYPNDTDIVTVRASTGEVLSEFPGSLTYEEMKEDPAQSMRADSSVDWNSLATLLYETQREWGSARINTGLSYRQRESDFSANYTDNDQLGFTLGPRIKWGAGTDSVLSGVDIVYDSLDVDRYLSEERQDVLAWGEFYRIAAAPYIFAQKGLGERTVVSGGARFEYAGTDNIYTEYDRDQIPLIVDTIFGPRPNPDYKNPPDVVTHYDGYIEKYGWAGELNFTRQISDELQMWCGYDRVYRYPTLDESASYQGFPLSDPLNRDLDPETGNNFEVGARFGGESWGWSFTGYYLDMNDEIAFVEYPDPVDTNSIIRLNKNVGSTRRLGLDSSIDWNQGWYGFATRWSLVDARIEGGDNDGNRVPLVPWANGTTSVWVFIIPEIRFSVTHTFVSDQYQGNDFGNDFPRKLDAYNLVGLGLFVNMSKHASLTANIDNVFNEQYASVAYSGGFYPSAGRSFRLGVGVEF